MKYTLIIYGKTGNSYELDAENFQMLATIAITSMQFSQPINPFSHAVIMENNVVVAITDGMRNLGIIDKTRTDLRCEIEP